MPGHKKGLSNLPGEVGASQKSWFCHIIVRGNPNERKGMAKHNIKINKEITIARIDHTELFCERHITNNVDIRLPENRLFCQNGTDFSMQCISDLHILY